jgi:hypothetical protein
MWLAARHSIPIMGVRDWIGTLSSLSQRDFTHLEFNIRAQYSEHQNLKSFKISKVISHNG